MNRTLRLASNVKLPQVAPVSVVPRLVLLMREEMATRGKKTNEKIRRFVIQTKMSSPEVSQQEITNRVSTNFSTEEWIDKSTVRRIIKEASLSAGVSIDRSDQTIGELRELISGRHIEFVRAVEAYTDELRMRMQVARSSTFQVAENTYGYGEKVLVDAIRRRDQLLAPLEQDFDGALDAEEWERASGLLDEIRSRLEQHVQL